MTSNDITRRSSINCIFASSPHFAFINHSAKITINRIVTTLSPLPLIRIGIVRLASSTTYPLTTYPPMSSHPSFHATTFIIHHSFTAFKLRSFQYHDDHDSHGFAQTSASTSIIQGSEGRHIVQGFIVDNRSIVIIRNVYNIWK